MDRRDGDAPGGLVKTEMNAAVSQGRLRSSPQQKTEGARKPVCLVSEGAWPCQHPDPGLLASRAMVQYSSVILSLSVCGPW